MKLKTLSTTQTLVAMGFVFSINLIMRLNNVIRSEFVIITWLLRLNWKIRFLKKKSDFILKLVFLKNVERKRIIHE